jgi:hypothetical protein
VENTGPQPPPAAATPSALFFDVPTPEEDAEMSLADEPRISELVSDRLSTNATCRTATAIPEIIPETIQVPDPRVSLLEQQLLDLKAQFESFQTSSTARADFADTQLTQLAEASNTTISQLQLVRVDIGANQAVMNTMNNTITLLSQHLLPAGALDSAKRPKTDTA